MDYGKRMFYCYSCRQWTHKIPVDGVCACGSFCIAEQYDMFEVETDLEEFDNNTRA